ncbi:hypothetical protein QVD17_34600 [Tagetes erecta]|uniref:NVL2 nucleolin binding domain-containing protein n=1 Tax=Tagetes erecta TaxID=13708 RepID=A0AAD8K2A8_TARER|nr:hypothetical protein QVD17_34600 [Tagetes erecta]
MGKSSKPPVKSSLFEKLLRRRVQETYGHSIPSIEELIDGLRAKYPEYGRHKSQLFTRMVKQTLDSDINNSNHKDKWKTVRNGDELRSFNVEDDDDDDDIASPSSRSPASKKVKKIDSREERLLMMEAKHIAARRRIELQSESSELYIYNIV